MSDLEDHIITNWSLSKLHQLLQCNSLLWKFFWFRSNLVLWSKIIEIGGDQFFARTLVIDLNGEWFRLKRDPGDIKFEWEWFTQYKTQNGMKKNTKIVQYQNRRSFILMSTDHWEKRHKWIYYDEVILIF